MQDRDAPWIVSGPTQPCHMSVFECRKKEMEKKESFDEMYESVLKRLPRSPRCKIRGSLNSF